MQAPLLQVYRYPCRLLLRNSSGQGCGLTRGVHQHTLSLRSGSRGPLHLNFCGLYRNGRYAKCPHYRPLLDVNIGYPVIRHDARTAKNYTSFPPHLVIVELIPHAVIVHFHPDEVKHHDNKDNSHYYGNSQQRNIWYLYNRGNTTEQEKQYEYEEIDNKPDDHLFRGFKRCQVGEVLTLHGLSNNCRNDTRIRVSGPVAIPKGT